MKNGDMPAMPVTKDTESADGAYLVGITKREHFAGLAMQGLLSDSANAEQKGYDVSLAQLAQDAVAQADALLAELEKDNGSENTNRI